MFSRLRQSFHRLRSFFRRAQLDRELDAEISSHLQFAIDENLQRGLSPAKPTVRLSSASAVNSKPKSSSATRVAFPSSTRFSRTFASPCACCASLLASPPLPS